MPCRSTRDSSRYKRHLIRGRDRQGKVFRSKYAMHSPLATPKDPAHPQDICRSFASFSQFYPFPGRYTLYSSCCLSHLPICIPIHLLLCNRLTIHPHTIYEAWRPLLWFGAVIRTKISAQARYSQSLSRCLALFLTYKNFLGAECFLFL